MVQAFRDELVQSGVLAPGGDDSPEAVARGLLGCGLCLDSGKSGRPDKVGLCLFCLCDRPMLLTGVYIGAGDEDTTCADWPPCAVV
jgi:hypothetical protein